MSLFKKLSSDGLEKAEDRTGGGYAPVANGIYDGKIKHAYLTVADSGAQAINLVIGGIDGKDYREQIYITNKKGENYYMTQSTPAKKAPLPGFTTINQICICASGKELSDQDAEDKLVNIYDYEQKKELPTSVPVLVDLIDQDITLGIIQQIEDVKKKDDKGVYSASGETKIVNKIKAVFNTDAKMTVNEAENGAEKPVFYHSWLEANKDKPPYDNTDAKKGGGAGGRPAGGGAANAGGPPKGNTTASAPTTEARKSLFGKKN